MTPPAAAAPLRERAAQFSDICARAEHASHPTSAARSDRDGSAESVASAAERADPWSRPIRNPVPARLDRPSIGHHPP
jgi:hypothetical protein